MLLLLRKSGSGKSQNTNRARRGSRERPDRRANDALGLANVSGTEFIDGG